MQLKTLQNDVIKITIFRNILHDKTIKKFINLLNSDFNNKNIFINRYCDFVYELYNHNIDFSNYLLELVLMDENVYTRMIQNQVEIQNNIEETLNNDLRILENLTSFCRNEKVDNLIKSNNLPIILCSKLNFKDLYYNSILNSSVNGFGIFSKYHTFIYKDKQIQAIKNNDPISLDNLIGYESERDLVIKNTLAFISGKKANNTLLYGDAGTGKSSTVKAIINKYYNRGIRLIEIKTQQIDELDDVIEIIANNPLKFIIFIDDLSFSSNNNNFITLKNILEGGLVSTRNNVLVYATSNRKHLVKENMKNRDGDELFINDSIQETLSLASRFGLTITFSKPLKKLYFELVTGIAKENNIPIDDDFYLRAEAFAIRNNGRSPRTAKQFIEFESIKTVKII